MTRQIQLPQGKFALVDDEDFEKVNSHKWYFYKDNRGCGRAIKTENGKSIPMSRFVMNATNGSLVDHVNGDGLDNRKSNLRFANHQQNGMNRKAQKNNKSGYKGVFWNKYKNKFEARISINKRKKTLGVFDNSIEAAKAYDEYAKKIFGEFAKLNFNNLSG